MYIQVIVGHICLALPDIMGNSINHLDFQTDCRFVCLFRVDFYLMSQTVRGIVLDDLYCEFQCKVSWVLLMQTWGIMTALSVCCCEMLMASCQWITKSVRQTAQMLTEKSRDT
jgi:hypothetical protein